MGTKSESAGERDRQYSEGENNIIKIASVSSLKGVAARISRGPLKFLVHHPDLVLSGLVVAMVGMMIVPLPTFILDILLTINITFAIILLLSSLYVPNAMSIASFPTLLLLTTLFRLSLNVSSTRLILLNGYAGEVINSFGRFVVKGNYVVGAVIFLILTVIQFIVIAKGSERVAEVSARFNLDSMPGKQMSIDADLRTGAISMEDAKRLRRELERENQFYGAMDGAMKFVKGDAIAGMVITGVNIVGGLAIGLLQKGLDFATALSRYTVLTIGDGLVSQIPSILIATSAGIVVTRVASSEENSDIARDISRQISKYPRALGIVSGLLVILSLLPGLPGIPFFIMGVASGCTAYLLLQRQEREVKSQPGSDAPHLIPGLLQPVLVEISSSLTKDLESLKEEGKLLVKSILLEQGVRIPTPGFRTCDSITGKGLLRVSLFGNDVLNISVPEEHLLVEESGERLREFRIEPVVPLSFEARECSFVANKWREALSGLGYPSWEADSLVLYFLRGVLRSNCHIFIGINETQNMLDEFSNFYPALVREVVPRITGLPELSELLRRLVEEGISVRNLRNILESVAKHGQAEKSIPALAELVRADMKAEISDRFRGENGGLPAYILNPILENSLLEAISSVDGSKVLSLDPDTANALYEVVEKEYSNFQHKPTQPAIITQPELRLLLRNFLKRRFPKIPVLSFEEIDRNTVIQPLGQINVEEMPQNI